MSKKIEHFGIPGMKWGVRRKNPSGGKQSSDSQTAGRLRKKSLSELSNDELKKLNTRLQLEQQYKSLSQGKVSAGRKIVSDVLKEVAKDTFKSFVSKALDKGTEKALDYAFTLKEKYAN